MTQPVSCPRCSTNVRLGANFCPDCGQSLAPPTREEVIEDIAKRFKNTGSSFWGSKREVKELPKILWDNELPEEMVTGRYKESQGLLVSTDRRMIFIDKGMFGSLKVEDFWYDKIASIESSRGWVHGSITIHASGNNAKIDMIPANEIDSFVLVQRNKLATAHSTHTQSVNAPSPSSTTAGPASLADELRELGDLHRQGVLTDDQFEKAKDRLLSNQ